MKSNVINNIQTSNESNLVESIIINNDTEVFLKDSLECSISTHTKSSTNILIPDSLNKQKNSQLIGNYTPISNTKQPLILKKKLMNKKKISSNDNTLGTKKIDYRYHPSYPMNVLDNIRIKKYYWLLINYYYCYFFFSVLAHYLYSFYILPTIFHPKAAWKRLPP